MTMDSHTASTVDVSAFRKAMGSFPTGVTVVTVASGDGSMHGVTVNSFSSVSLHPMLVLACLNETSRAVGLIERAGAFGVNVLSAGQQWVSSWFANRHRPADSAMFDGVPLEPGVTGCPVLAGAAASFECRLRQSYRAGDHLIVLGEVVAVVHRPQLKPLIFHAGTYKSCWRTRSRSRTCPAGPGGTPPIRSGWLPALSAAASSPASWPPRSSGSSGCTPGGAAI
jgi:flavin reductase